MGRQLEPQEFPFRTSEAGQEWIDWPDDRVDCEDCALRNGFMCQKRRHSVIRGLKLHCADFMLAMGHP